MNQFGAQNMVSQIKKVLLEKPHKNMSKVDYKKWNYHGPLDQKLINSNYDEFLNILKISDIEIIYLDSNNTNEELCDSIFTHDPSLIINNGSIILNMSKELRKDEINKHINLYKKLNIPIIGRIINGKNKVIYVSEIMLSLDQFPVVSSEVYLKEALEKMNKIQLGIACIIDADNKLIGVLTDGDIRRKLLNVQKPFSAFFIDDVITHSAKSPVTVLSNDTLEFAVEVMGKKQIWD